jgi:hypothetical protein
LGYRQGFRDAFKRGHLCDRPQGTIHLLVFRSNQFFRLISQGLHALAQIGNLLHHWFLSRLNNAFGLLPECGSRNTTRIAASASAVPTFTRFEWPAPATPNAFRTMIEHQGVVAW